MEDGIETFAFVDRGFDHRLRLGERQRRVRAEQDAVAATVRAVEAETALEDMRSQVIDSTFKAMELQRELEDLKSEAQRPWWKKVFSSGGDSKDARK